MEVMECGNKSRDPASESIANIERVFSLGPVRPKLDFRGPYLEENQCDFKRNGTIYTTGSNIKYRKTQCFVSIVGCLGLKVCCRSCSKLLIIYWVLYIYQYK